MAIRFNLLRKLPEGDNWWILGASGAYSPICIPLKTLQDG